MIPVSQPDLSGNEATYAAQAIGSGWVSSRGQWSGQFAEDVATMAGTAFAVPTNTGTAALHVLLAAYGIGPGDEVIVPALSYIATANAVTYCGATPVFADVTPDTWTIDPRAVIAVITPRTRAIIAVHLFGEPADMLWLDAIAAAHGLALFEDAAQAHGARYDMRPVGSLGKGAAFSFFGNKIITCGEGGAVTTNDPDLAERARLLVNQGHAGDYRHPVVGYNYRLTNPAAAIGCAQMERLHAFLDRRRHVAERYQVLLRGKVAFQVSDPRSQRAWWQVAVLVDDPGSLALHLADAGIETRPMFPPLTQQAHYEGVAPVADDIAEHGLVLPTYAALTDADIDHIAEVVCTHS